MVTQSELQVQTRGRGLIDITGPVSAAVADAACDVGLVQVFCHHTSASLIITENADPDVHADLLDYFERLVIDGHQAFRHRAEGPDDMAAHVRSVLTASCLSIPVRRGVMDLGTWQGVYLFEHRTQPHRRRLTCTILGANAAR